MAGPEEVERLEQVLQRREAELSALQQIAMAVASARDLPEVLQTIVLLTTQVMGCPKAAIFELDDRAEELTIRAWEGLSEAYAQASWKVDARSTRAMAVLEGRPWTVPGVFSELGLEDLALLGRQEGYSAFVDVPLRGRERALGILSAYYPEVHDFTPTEVEMLVSFADQASVALETTRLLRDQERRIAELASMEEVGRAISGTLDLSEVLARVYEQVSRLMNSTNFYIALYDPVQDEVSFPLAFERGERQAWRARKGSQGLTEHVLRAGQPLLFRKGVQEELELRGIESIGAEAESWLGAPMQIGSRTIGVITVQSYTPGTSFDEQHQRILQAIARQAAVAVQNACTMAEMRRLNEDLQRTLDTQKQLLETIRELSTPVVPLLEGTILLPLVGHIDGERTQRILEQLLSGVQAYRSRVVIVDITGVPVVDTMVAQALVQAAQAVRLLGAEPVLVGIMPEVAQTMVGLGVDLRALVTRADLQSGLEYAMEQLQRQD